AHQEEWLDRVEDGEGALREGLVEQLRQHHLRARRPHQAHRPRRRRIRRSRRPRSGRGEGGRGGRLRVAGGREAVLRRLIGSYCVAWLQGLAAWIRPRPNIGSLPGGPRSMAVAASESTTRSTSVSPSAGTRAAMAAVT